MPHAPVAEYSALNRECLVWLPAQIKKEVFEPIRPVVSDTRQGHFRPTAVPSAWVGIRLDGRTENSIGKTNGVWH